LMEQSEGLISKNELEIDIEKLEQLIEAIKKAIFEMCDIDRISFDDNHFLKKEENKEIKDKMEKEGRYTYHKSLLISLLQRPLNLRRVNIFTLNYDLAFEYACDELGIEYINGFVGFNERNFRPEVYNYDFFFPGDTTEGKVRRIERVIKYYKLHGSLNWVYKNQNKNNPYGLYEIPIELVRMKLTNKTNKTNNLGDIMIYPTSSKKEYTLKIGAINKNYFGNILYMDREYFSKVFDKTYSDNSFIIKMNNSDEVEKMASKLQDNPYVANVSDNSKIQENLDNFISGLDIIVVVMVLCSLALALVVLYNLINVNVSERQRELSTIKVLGFYPREVTIYVFREIFYLSIIGIVIGNYIAYRLYLKIILELASRTMMFSSRVPIAVYALSTGVTLVIIIFVMAIMHRRLKKVNMVESLKAIE